jgi:hypothetical protein
MGYFDRMHPIPSDKAALPSPTGPLISVDGPIKLYQDPTLSNDEGIYNWQTILLRSIHNRMQRVIAMRFAAHD